MNIHSQKYFKFFIFTNKSIYKMRRKEKKITERLEIDEIIHKSNVCRLAFSKNNIPYIMPISFGYNGKKIFIHTATEGKK